MFQEVQSRKTKSWKKRVRISNNAIIDGNDLWLVSNYTNVLMEYDLNKGNLKNVYPFPGEFIDYYLTISYVKVEDKIFFAPYNNQTMWCFHIGAKEFEKIDLNLKDNEKVIQKKFRIVIKYKRDLILIGFGIQCILRIDTITHKIERYDEYLIELEKRGIKAEDAFWGYGYQLFGDNIYLPMIDHNIIIIFHLMNNSFELCDIYGLDTKGFDAIDYYNGKFILISSGGKEIIWDYENKQKLESRLNLPKAYTRNYWKTIRYNDISIYFPLFDTKIWVRNKEEKVSTLSFQYPKPEIFPTGSRYEFIKQCNERVYFQVRTNGDCYYIDLQQMVVYPLKLEVLNDNISNQIVKKIFDSMDGKEINETEIINIVNYLSLFKYNKIQETQKSKQNGTLIYRSLK